MCMGYHSPSGFPSYPVGISQALEQHLLSTRIENQLNPSVVVVVVVVPFCRKKMQ